MTDGVYSHRPGNGVAQQSAGYIGKRRRLVAAQKRAENWKNWICKIYEDNALGKLPDARYRALMPQYAKETTHLRLKLRSWKRLLPAGEHEPEISGEIYSPTG